MTLWHYVENEERVGPVSADDLNRLAETGLIQDHTLVWREGLDDWIPYSEARPGLTGADAGREPAAAAATPEASGQARTDAAFGGFWIRVAAKILDWIILTAINSIVALSVFLLLLAVTGITRRNAPFHLILVPQLGALVARLAINAAYATFFVGRFAATPGKMVCGLRVVMADASPVSYGRALARHFAGMLSSLTLMIGYVIAAFDPEKRTLHDHICGTRVIRK